MQFFTLYNIFFYVGKLKVCHSHNQYVDQGEVNSAIWTPTEQLPTGVHSLNKLLRTTSLIEENEICTLITYKGVFSIHKIYIPEELALL